MVIEWTSPVPVWSDTYLPERVEKSSNIEYINLASDDETETPSQPPGSRNFEPISSTAPLPEPPPTAVEPMSPITKHHLPGAQGRSQTVQLERSGSPASTPANSDIHVSITPPLVPSSPSKAGGMQASERHAWKPSLSRRRHSPSEPSPPQQGADVMLSDQPGFRQSPTSLTGPERLPPSPSKALATRKVWSAEELSEVEPLVIDFLRRSVCFSIIVTLCITDILYLPQIHTFVRYVIANTTTSVLFYLSILSSHFAILFIEDGPYHCMRRFGDQTGPYFACLFQVLSEKAKLCKLAAESPLRRGISRT